MAGNVGAATITATLLSEFKPKLVIMLGIAAGMREKVALGDVVISRDRPVVAYEGAALENGQSQARPETYRPVFGIQQKITTYLASPLTVRERIRAAQRSRSDAGELGDGAVTKDLMPSRNDRERREAAPRSRQVQAAARSSGKRSRSPRWKLSASSRPARHTAYRAW